MNKSKIKTRVYFGWASLLEWPRWDKCSDGNIAFLAKGIATGEVEPFANGSVVLVAIPFLHNCGVSACWHVTYLSEPTTWEASKVSCKVNHTAEQRLQHQESGRPYNHPLQNCN